MYHGSAGRHSQTIVQQGKRSIHDFDRTIQLLVNQKPSSFENTLANQVPISITEMHHKKLLRNVQASLPENVNQVRFVPLN